MRIGLLLNHEQIHHVAHCAPVAFEISRIRPDVEVSIIASTDAQIDEARRFEPRFPEHRCEFRRIRLPAPLGLVSRALDSFVPFRKLAMLRTNARFLRSFDAIIVPEKTSLFLGRAGRGAVPKMIHTRHGAGDRAIGFNEESAQFDLVLLSGPKIVDRLSDAGCLPESVATVGYPKFDAVGAFDRPQAKLFDNDRTTVLYSPHPSPHLSSWYAFGEQILDFFYESEEFNLIFGPHVMLFQRNLNIALDRFSVGRPGRMDPKYEGSPHILIDPGSPASADMTYTLGADVYLGDVSSQIYEFLLRPRPCLFLDAHDQDWAEDPNFLQWKAGPVITNADDLGGKLRDAIATHPSYEPVQREIFAYSIDLAERPSAERAAEAILDFLDRGATGRDVARGA